MAFPINMYSRESCPQKDNFFLDEMKIANVVMIFKSNDRDILNNYMVCAQPMRDVVTL